MLVKVFKSVRYLARQGLAFGGHEESEGNFQQLLKLQAEDDKQLSTYIKQSTSFISPQAQNEMLQDLSHSIVRSIADDVKKDGVFAVIVDGTQDINGTEQESICIRHVNDDLDVHEDFIGLYEAPSTTGGTLSKVVADVLVRLGLSINNLRAQTYDGTSNMSEKYIGCQAKIKEQQPLAMFFHCSSHVSNLVVQHAVSKTPLVRDALQWVQDLGVLYSRSGKYKAIFVDIATEEYDSRSAKIRPLCPPRWLCRQSAVESVIKNYAAVIKSLTEMSEGEGGTATKANGLLDRFEKGEVLLALQMINKPLAILETLNNGLQARTLIISGMKESVKAALSEIGTHREERVFEVIFMDLSQFPYLEDDLLQEFLDQHQPTNLIQQSSISGRHIMNSLILSAPI
ncbi:zinc finger MYM-type protein 1-like [Anneissia japonica]|uniref:zinc finger MYM-type protein 1-like n=1 Tax=Anneissia japonica TaxID=1529436 RepID=UPI0014255B88|nr:zinc finger MYM-type protein 1-like [Anneissia japonica]